LQRHRVAAPVAERNDVLVERPALMTEHVAGMERIGSNLGAAARIAADGTQVMQPLQVAALALPIPDGIIDKLELAQTTKIGDWENGAEYTFKTGIFALLRKQVHLQKALI
jgi:hypothetical protein